MTSLFIGDNGKRTYTATNEVVVVTDGREHLLKRVLVCVETGEEMYEDLRVIKSTVVRKSFWSWLRGFK